MRWNTDKRYQGGGYWRCTVLVNERRRDRYANQPGVAETIRQRRRSFWHRPDGGYIRRRRAELQAQRRKLVSELAQLRQEAERC